MIRFNRHMATMSPLPQAQMHEDVFQWKRSRPLNLDRSIDKTWPHIRSLLVPLDGSLTAEHALPHALAIARRSGATIRLIHVHSRLDHVEPWQMSLSHATMERRKSVKRDYLQGIARRIARTNDVSLKSTLVDSSDIEGTLRQAAIGSDLLVAASARRGFWRRLWTKSLVEGLRRHLRPPILLVRGYPYPIDLTGDPMPQHILIPLDGSEIGESAIAPATMIGRLNDAAFTLLNVQQEVWTGCSLGQMVPLSYLDSIARRARSVLSVVETQAFTAKGAVGSAVAEYAKKCSADWIAIGSRRDEGLYRLLRESVADSIARQSNAPVLIAGSDTDLDSES